MEVLIFVHISLIVMAFYLLHITNKAANGESLPGSPGLRTSATTAGIDQWKTGHSAAKPVVKLNVFLQVVTNIIAVILELIHVNPILALNIPVICLVAVCGYAVFVADKAVCSRRNTGSI